MEVPVIAILDQNDKFLTKLDNNAPKALHYFNDTLENFLVGTASTFECTIIKDNPDSEFVKEGNKLTFKYAQRDYFMNIIRIEEDEHFISVLAMGLSLELTNQYVEPYEATQAQSFTKYLYDFGLSFTVIVTKNEISTKQLKLSWEGTDTLLNRILSLANKFDAEVEFIHKVKSDYSLENIHLNIYKKHDDNNQGIGNYRPEIKLEYGKNVQTIKRTIDISNLKTAIKPVGDEGLTLIGTAYEEKDENGKVIFYSHKSSGWIYAPIARDQFPSNLTAEETDRFIYYPWSYSTDNQNVLWGQGLAQLKKMCVPEVTYDVDGYFEGVEIGDTIRIYDDGYIPTLMLEARVSQQKISFTAPENGQTTFTNIKVLESEVSQNLLDKMQDLIEANKVYDCNILTTNGILFKKKTDSTKLIAMVRDIDKDVTNQFDIRWTKDGKQHSELTEITVYGTDFQETAVYRFEARRKGVVRGGAEVTLANVKDGTDGENGTNGIDGEDGQDGENAINGYLTREAIVLLADSKGVVSDFSTAQGYFRVTDGYENVTTGVTFSVKSKIGCTITIDSKSGFYAVTGMSSNHAEATLKAVYKGVTIEKSLTLAKSIAGQNGQDGEDGKTPTEALSGYLTTETLVLVADPSGHISDYSRATGYFKVMFGNQDVSNKSTFKVTAPFNCSVTINATTGFYYVSSMDKTANTGTATLTATYQTQSVVKNLMVIKSKQGASGQPTGIIESPTAPPSEDRYVGMLWKNTTNNLVYRWTGSSWKLFIFEAENINVETLSALTAIAGEIYNPFDFTVGGIDRYQGRTLINNSSVETETFHYNAGKHFNTINNTMNYLGFQMSSETPTGFTERTISMSVGTVDNWLTFYDKNKGQGKLRIDDLIDTGWRNITLRNETTAAASLYPSYRAKGRQVELRLDVGSIASRTGIAFGLIPSQYAPKHKLIVPCLAPQGATVTERSGVCEIRADGQLVFVAPANTGRVILNFTYFLD